MKELLNHQTHGAALQQLGIWMLLVTPVAALAGSASALFLWSLDQVTHLRFEYPWLLWLLPLAGPMIYWSYQTAGRNSERGTNLVLEEIHQPGGGVPCRMAPLVLGATLVTHLFGGSAGREGTAIQMGGGLAGGFIDYFRIAERNRRLLLLAGVAAGFGSVFGTPLAGAVFAVEVLTVGRIRHDFLVPCLLAGILGDLTCSAWGIQHTPYHIEVATVTTRFGVGSPDLVLLVKAVGAGIVFGLVSLLFTDFAHFLHHQFKHLVAKAWLRPVIGGLLVVALTYLLGTRSYLGLGVTSPNPADVTILSCFHLGGATPWSWFWKLLFTAVTLSSGFKGGEVTPIFFIGAALGNTLSTFLGVPTDLFAGLGFVAVFAGASNTPIASTLLGIELFGAEHAVYLAVACFVAYFFSGHSGIYGAQRVGVPKTTGQEIPAEITLEELRQRRARTDRPKDS